MRYRLLFTAAALACVAGALAAAGMFERPAADYEVQGALELSDGRTFSGTLFTTLGRPLTIYDREAEKHLSFTLREVSRIDVAVDEEHEEPFWYWKESGSDEKVYTGRTYPWRRYLTTVTFASGRTVTGDLDALIYLRPAEPLSLESTDLCPDASGKVRFLLHKRHKGEEGQRPDDLAYVKSITVSAQGGS